MRFCNLEQESVSQQTSDNSLQVVLTHSLHSNVRWRDSSNGNKRTADHKFERDTVGYNDKAMSAGGLISARALRKCIELQRLPKVSLHKLGKFGSNRASVACLQDKNKVNDV